MMDYNILEILSYIVVGITSLTMIFGIYAYKLYKLREKRVIKYTDTEIKSKEKEQFLYFEEKEILW
jgi:hypothetical protein